MQGAAAGHRLPIAACLLVVWALGCARAVAVSAEAQPDPAPAMDAPAADPAPLDNPLPPPDDPVLAELAKTVRFLDAFPGSPVARDELLKQYQAAVGAQRAGAAEGVDVWARDPVGEWMHGPVPTRITPTMMLLAWQRVISEHYPDTLLTFAPRLRPWCLRVLERIGARMAAIETAAAGGNAEKKLERARLSDLARSFCEVVLQLPGPTDRQAGLPEWTKDLRLPADSESRRRERFDAGVLAGMPPLFSENLAAEQVFTALMGLQTDLALHGEQRMRWGALVIGLLIADREDARLLADLNRWIDAYSASASVNNDFLSLAAMTQAPRDPDALAVWQKELAKSRAQRKQALQAAGYVWPAPAPAAPDQPEGPPEFGEDWRLLPWRCGPLDQLAALEGGETLTAEAAAKRLARFSLPNWENLFGDEAEMQTQPTGTRSGMQSAVRAVVRVRGEPPEEQLLNWCLLAPVHFTRGPMNPAPLRDDEALGPVWIDGGAAFYTALAQAAQAHAGYLQSLGIDHGNTATLAGICADLSDWAEGAEGADGADGANRADGKDKNAVANPVGKPPTDVALRRLLHARQWLAEWLQIDLAVCKGPRTTVAYMRSPNGSEIARKAGILAQLQLNWTVQYAVRPQSQSGLETANPAAGPVLTAGLALRLRESTFFRAASTSGWTENSLQAAVLGPDRKGPVRWLDALSPSSPDFDLADKTRRKLRVWLARDPAGLVAAVAAGRYHREGDFERLLTAAMTPLPDRPEHVEAILKAFPDQTAAILAGLEQCGNQQATVELAQLARRPGYASAAGPMAASWHQGEAQTAYLAWLRRQADPEEALTALLAHPHRAWASIWLSWYSDRPPDPIRALLLGQMAPLLNDHVEPFRQRVERGLQISNRQRLYYDPPRQIVDVATQEDLTWISGLLKKNLAYPPLQPVAVAGLMISDRDDAYGTLELFFADPANAGFAMDPAHVFLLGTSRVTGARPERGRELLRAWVQKPASDAAGNPRIPSLDENQTWALAVDLLEREYILTDGDVPALVARYVQEIGADVVQPRMRFPTHAAFATAYFINPDRTLDLIAAALNSEDRFQRDAALAILTTQTRVDELNGSRPENLPALENLPLRLEDTPEAERQAQTANWNAWLKQRRGAVRDQIRAHLR